MPPMLSQHAPVSPADTLKISPERALDLYYSTKVYEQMIDPKYGLQLMSDDYILEELIAELRETQ